MRWALNLDGLLSLEHMTRLCIGKVGRFNKVFCEARHFGQSLAHSPLDLVTHNTQSLTHSHLICIAWTSVRVIDNSNYQGQLRALKKLWSSRFRLLIHTEFADYGLE
jgi:hypothetical protein